jgi:hypothetical protein
LEDIDVEGRIILKRNLEDKSVKWRVWLGMFAQDRQQTWAVVDTAMTTHGPAKEG